MALSSMSTGWLSHHTVYKRTSTAEYPALLPRGKSTDKSPKSTTTNPQRSNDRSSSQNAQSYSLRPHGSSPDPNRQTMANLRRRFQDRFGRFEPQPRDSSTSGFLRQSVSNVRISSQRQTHESYSMGFAAGNSSPTGQRTGTLMEPRISAQRQVQEQRAMVHAPNGPGPNYAFSSRYTRQDLVPGGTGAPGIQEPSRQLSQASRSGPFLQGTPGSHSQDRTTSGGQGRMHTGSHINQVGTANLGFRLVPSSLGSDGRPASVPEDRLLE